MAGVAPRGTAALKWSEQSPTSPSIILSIPVDVDRPKRGMTLVELLVSMAVFVILGSSLVVFLRVGIDTYRVGETRRELYERAESILDQFESDLENVFADPSRGYQGQVDVLLVSNRDSAGRPVLRLVRTLGDELRNPITRTAGTFVGGTERYDYFDDAAEMERGALMAPGGLQEVAYSLDPRPGAAVLWRGVRSPIGGRSTLFDDANLYRRAEDGSLSLERARPLAAGVLYLGYKFWSQDTETWDEMDEEKGPWLEWNSTRGPLDGIESPFGVWSDRPGSRHEWRDDIFPQSIEVTLALEPARVVALGRLTAPIGPTDTTIPMSRTDLYPDGAHPFVRIGGEWMRFGGKKDRELSEVQRGLRGTKATEHARGETVIYGATFSRVIRIPSARRSVWGAR